ncbi:MAG: 3,4-dihydroxy-2-butanone-4-phosphate synthase, partial [Coraliomargaritaceae bacterium]
NYIMESTTESENAHFDSIESAIKDIAAGKPVIVTDDEARENEGDLILAAEKATTESINQMILHARGLICVPMQAEQLRSLGINPMSSENRESHQTDFAISVDAAKGISTGISAHDRAKTIQILSNPNSVPEDLVQPGHVFPLRAKAGGVLQRAGHTEAAVDLAVLAGLNPSGVICEILNEDGSLARLPDLVEFKKKHQLKLISISQLIEFRHEKECLIKRISSKKIQTEYGEFDFHLYKSILDDRQHIALSMGELNQDPTLVRVHSEYRLSDLFKQLGTQGHNNLDQALKKIAEAKHGVFVYIEQKHGGIKFLKDILKSEQISTPKMDPRDSGIGAQILADLGLNQIKILTDNPRKVVGLDAYNLTIVDQISLSS